MKIIKNCLSDCVTFKNCPEIRKYVVMMYIIKMLSWMTFLILLPLICVALFCLFVSKVFGEIGDVLVMPSQFILPKFEKMQKQQINLARAIVPLKEIQRRNAANQKHSN